MKKRFLKFCLFLILLVGCNSTDAPNCIKTSGVKVISKHEIYETFSKIIVGNGIELSLEKSDENSLEIQTGSNLISGVHFSVKDNVLTIEDSNSCNWIRRYIPVKVLLKVTDLIEVYSKSQYVVTSVNQIDFPVLSLRSALYNDEVGGSFILDVNCSHLTLEANFNSYFKIVGNTDKLNVSLYAGTTRVEAQDLQVNEVNVFQRSSNDILLHPNQKIIGDIFSTGNILLYHTPPIIQVNQHYTGKIIYKN